MHKEMMQAQNAGCMVYSKENYDMVNAQARKTEVHS